MTKEQQAALDLLYNTYSPLGYDMASIAGIAGNGLVESGLNPDSVSASKTYHGAWLNHKNIRKAIESMYNDYSMLSQMKFIDDWNNRADNVMKGNYSAYTSTNAGKYKKSGYKTARDAADAFMRYYERPVIMKDGKVVGYQKANERYANAEAAYKYLYDKYGSPEITEYNLPDGGKRMIFKPRQVDVQLSDAVAVQKPTVITPVKRALPVAEVQKTLPETVTTGRRIQPLASLFSAELPSLDDVFDLGGPEDLFKQYVAEALGVPNMHLKMPSYKEGKIPYSAGRPVAIQEVDKEEEIIRKQLEQRSDATTVLRQEPVLPIRREYGKVVDPKLVERKQLQQPTIKRGSTYKVTPRPQTFAGRVAQVVGKDWTKADASSAGVGISLSQIPVIGPVLSAAWGAPDFGYDLNGSVHNLTDQESHINAIMSGIALLPYTNRFNLLKGKSYIDRLRNAYNSLMTKYNTSREVNKALKTAKLSDAAQDGTSGIFDEYAKQWFNNEVSFIRPFKSSGGKGNTVGDVIDYNLGLWGGREKPLSELTENLRYRIATALSKDERFPKGTRIIHMDDSGPLPVNRIGFVPKDASNSNSVWNSSLQGLPEIWWNRGTPYYDARGYRSVQDIPRTIVSDVEDLKQHGVVLNGLDVMHGPGIIPFQAVHYGIQPNPFGWFDRIKFVGQ